MKHETDLQLDDLTVRQLLEAVGARRPTPGGGAVAAITATLGAALGRMVVGYSQGKSSLADHADLHAEAAAGLERFSRRALELAEEDVEAYGRLNQLSRLDKDDPQRTGQWAAAVEAVLAAPRGSLDTCLDLLDLLRRLTGTTNRMLASDLAIAAVLAEAAARAAAWNVTINLPLLGDDGTAAGIRAETERQVQRARSICREIESACGG